MSNVLQHRQLSQQVLFQIPSLPCLFLHSHHISKIFPYVNRRKRAFSHGRPYGNLISSSVEKSGAFRVNQPPLQMNNMRDSARYNTGEAHAVEYTQSANLPVHSPATYFISVMSDSTSMHQRQLPSLKHSGTGAPGNVHLLLFNIKVGFLEIR